MVAATQGKIVGNRESGNGALQNIPACNGNRGPSNSSDTRSPPITDEGGSPTLLAAANNEASINFAGPMPQAGAKHGKRQSGRKSAAGLVCPRNYVHAFAISDKPA
jgi:hypothetical protein